MTSLSRTLRPYGGDSEGSAPRSIPELIDHIDAGLERMIVAQMEAYPAHWSAEERRSMAEQHLLGERG